LAYTLVVNLTFGKAHPKSPGFPILWINMWVQSPTTINLYLEKWPA